MMAVLCIILTACGTSTPDPQNAASVATATNLPATATTLPVSANGTTIHTPQNLNLHYPGATPIPFSDAIFLGPEPGNMAALIKDSERGALVTNDSYSTVVAYYQNALTAAGYDFSWGKAINHSDESFTIDSAANGENAVTIWILSPTTAKTGSFAPGYDSLAGHIAPGQTLITYIAASRQTLAHYKPGLNTK